MKRTAFALALFVLAPTPAWAAGEACGSTKECADGFHCVQNVCVDGGVPTPEPKRDVQPIHGAFIGGSLGFSLPAIWSNFGEALTASLRFGALTRGGLQIALDASPTLLVNQGSFPAGLFDAVITIGGFVPLSEGVSWIFRGGIGGGVLAGRESPRSYGNAPPFGSVELRADVFGVAVRTGDRTVFEITVPSVRIAFVPSYDSHDAVYLFVVGVAYDRFL